MAHKLVPHEGEQALSTDEVLRRFARHFDFLQVSRALGREYMDAVLAELKETASQAAQPDAVDIAGAEADRVDALHMVVCEQPVAGAAFFATTVIRGVMLIDYQDREHELQAETLVLQAAELLGYELALV